MQSSIDKDSRCIKSSNVRKVEYNKIVIPKGYTLTELGGNNLEKIKLCTISNKKTNDTEKREHGIDIQNNEHNLNPTPKRKCCENEKIDTALLFLYPFCYKYDEEEEVKNTLNELYGKTFSFQNDNIIWISLIVIDDITSSRVNVNMSRGNYFVSITKQEKERLITKSDANLSTEYWFNDYLIEFWMCW